MENPNGITIDLSALVHNLRQVRRLIGDHVKIMAVVKADAYGHGLEAVARTLASEKVHFFGVSFLNEAIRLKNRGVATPVILLGGVSTREECQHVVELGLTPVIYDMSAAELLHEESRRAGKKTAVHLKVDTGMGRLGISCEDIGLFSERIMALKGLRIEALLSHLSSADEEEKAFTAGQIRRFNAAVETVRSRGARLSLNSLANSAGIMAHKDAHFQMVRPGIMLYGGLPSPEFESPVELRPAMHFRGRVLQVRDLPHGTPVSYGRTYRAEGTRRMAVLSAGYENGLSRNMSNRGRVLIKGKRTPIAGKVCMNLTVCDITGHPDVSPGDEAVFLGVQGREAITGDDMATWAGTISYEVFCAIGHRNEKEYVS